MLAHDHDEKCKDKPKKLVHALDDESWILQQLDPRDERLIPRVLTPELARILTRNGGHDQGAKGLLVVVERDPRVRHAGRETVHDPRASAVMRRLSKNNRPEESVPEEMQDLPNPIVATMDRYQNGRHVEIGPTIVEPVRRVEVVVMTER